MPIESMSVAVLMGGLGTRLQSKTAGLPKAMADIHGKPFFQYQLAILRSRGLKNFVFCVGHGADAIEAYFGDGKRFDANICYSRESDRLLGTAGALKKALPLLEKDFIVCYGDSYMDIDYRDMLRRYRVSGTTPAAMMVVYRNEGRFEKSNVLFKNGRVVNYDKHRPSADMAHVDYGVSVLSAEALGGVVEGREADLSDVYHQLSAEGRLAGYEVHERFYEIGAPASLEEFRELVRKNLLVKKPAIFLDRDGTLNEAVDGAGRPEPGSPLERGQLKLLPRAAEALGLLRSMGYRLIVVSNQPAAAKGEASLEELHGINERLETSLKDVGVSLDAVLACFHHPSGGASGDAVLIGDCDCRKPKPGLLQTAVRRFNTDLEASYMVGDSAKDIEAGRAMRVKCVSVGAEAREAGADLSFESVYEFAVHLKKVKKT